MDRYDNLTKALTSECVNHMSVEAEGLNQSAIDFTWQVKTKFPSKRSRGTWEGRVTIE